jgi:hypothetical protein
VLVTNHQDTRVVGSLASGVVQGHARTVGVVGDLLWVVPVKLSTEIMYDDKNSITVHSRNLHRLLVIVTVGGTRGSLVNLDRFAKSLITNDSSLISKQVLITNNGLHTYRPGDNTWSSCQHVETIAN